MNENKDLTTFITEMKDNWTALTAKLEGKANKEEIGAQLAEFQATMKSTAEQVDALGVKMNTPGGEGSEGSDGPTLEEKAYGLYLRKGERGLGPDELKALSTDSDPDGGYLVTPNRRDAIIERVRKMSPMRELATVETISMGDTLEILSEKGDYDAGWVGEREARPETDTGELDLLRIQAHEIYAKPKATQKQLDDPATDVEAWINRKVADKFARTEASAFIVGDGVKKPFGITEGGLTSYNSEDADEITLNGLIKTYFKLNEVFRAGATWLMNDDTLIKLYQLRDNQDRPLVEPDLRTGFGWVLFGRPIREAVDLPGEAANAIPIYFGDWAMAYTILQRQQVNILRDPYSSKPWIEFYTTTRVGGRIVNTDAAVALKCAVTA